jgi:hypothetical protein
MTAAPALATFGAHCSLSVQSLEISPGAECRVASGTHWAARRGDVRSPIKCSEMCELAHRSGANCLARSERRRRKHRGGDPG